MIIEMERVQVGQLTRSRIVHKVKDICKTNQEEDNKRSLVMRYGDFVWASMRAGQMYVM